MSHWEVFRMPLGRTFHVHRGKGTSTSKEARFCSILICDGAGGCPKLGTWDGE
jgi:hypothetical protein